MPKKPTTPAPLTSHTHADMRANIPTEELRDFIAGKLANHRDFGYLGCEEYHPGIFEGQECERRCSDVSGILFNNRLL